MQTTAASITTQDMRLFCRVRDRLQALSRQSDDFLNLTTDLRRHYIERIGLTRYLADMLSYHAGKPANYCTAQYEGEPPCHGSPSMRVLDFLIDLTNKHPSGLPPHRVEVREAGSIRVFNI